MTERVSVVVFKWVCCPFSVALRASGVIWSPEGTIMTTRRRLRVTLAALCFSGFVSWFLLSDGLLSKCRDLDMQMLRFRNELPKSSAMKSQLNVYVSIMTYNRYVISTLSILTLVRALKELRRHHNNVFVHMYDDASTDHAAEKRILVEDLISRGIIQKYDVNLVRRGNLQVGVLTVFRIMAIM